MCMYSGAKTVVRKVYGNSKSFEVKVGIHQGSALSPLLFVIIVEKLNSLKHLVRTTVFAPEYIHITAEVTEIQSIQNVSYNL